VPPKAGETRRHGDERATFTVRLGLLLQFLVVFVEGIRNAVKGDQAEENVLIVRRVHVPARLRDFREKKLKSGPETHFVIDTLIFQRFQGLVIPADGAMRGRNQAASSHNVGSNINTSGRFVEQRPIIP
jgi:hypothetical protein